MPRLTRRRASIAWIALGLVILAAFVYFNAGGTLQLGNAACIGKAEHCYPEPADQSAPQQATVVRVVDGDTIIVRHNANATETTVRLAGVDTPETVKPDSDPECYGPEASAHLTKMLPPGTTITLTTDTHQDDLDRYGRELRYVTVLKAGVVTIDDVAAALIRDGYGTHFTGTDRDETYATAEVTAQNNNAGLWGACGPDAETP